MIKKKNSKQDIDPKPAFNTVSRPGLLPLLVALIAFALYANTLGHEFTVDDAMVITKNKLTARGIAALPEIFQTPYRAGFHDRQEGLYRPLPVAVFAVLHELAGNKPFLYHLLNVIMYAMTSALAARVLLLWFAGWPLWVPAFAALWFTVHPIHTEVVANVKSMDEVLALLFLLTSMLASYRFLAQGRAIWLIAAAGSFLLSLLSKESAASGLLLLPLSWYYFRQPSRSQWGAFALGLTLAFGIYLTLRIQALGSLVNFQSIELINNSLAEAGNDYGKRLATAIYIIGIYIKLLLIPQPLSFDYSYNTIPLKSFTDATVWLVVVLLVFLAVVGLRGLRTRSVGSFGLWFFALTLAPVANIVQLIESTMAERFLFAPSLGFCMAVTAWLVRKKPVTARSEPVTVLNLLPPGRWRWLLLAPLVLSVMTVVRNNAWKSNYTLLTTDVQTRPNSARIRYALGSTLIYEKALSENDPRRRTDWLNRGIAQLKTGVSILPYYGEAWFNMGFAYNELKRYDSAVVCFERAMHHMNKLTDVQWIQIGLAYGESGRYQPAFSALHQALAQNDTSFHACNNMGLFYTRAGRYDSALHYLQRAIQLHPDNSKALYNLGNVYAALGQYSTAIVHYRNALHSEPRFVDALTNLGNSFAIQGLYDSALVYFERAYALSPDNYNVRYNMSLTYRLKGDTAAARRYGVQP